MKHFDEYINENSRGSRYYDSIAYDASFAIKKIIEDKFNMKVNDFLIKDILHYTVKNDLAFYSKEYGHLYYGVNVFLTSVNETKFKNYINVLTELNKELNKYNVIDTYIYNSKLSIYFKLTNEMKEYVKTLNKVNKYNL